VDDRAPNRPSALVLAAGEAPETPPHLDHIGYVVAADGGLEHARRYGIGVDAVVGDLDSADPAHLAGAVAQGAAVERHPVDKDATDWELALRHVRDAGYHRVVVVGGGGGRLDHFISNALVLASPDFSDLDLVWHVGSAAVRIGHPGTTTTVTGEPGDFVSLLAVGGSASGVTTEGLRWALDRASLASGTSRGVSNELVKATATVSLAAGALLVIHERKDR